MQDYSMDDVLRDKDPQSTTNGSEGNGMKAEKLQLHRICYVIGTITTLFGALTFLYLFSELLQLKSTPFFSSMALTPVKFVIAVVTILGVSMLFVAPGVTCIGVGKLIELIEHDRQED